jgi:hypothetical protein
MDSALTFILKIQDLLTPGMRTAVAATDSGTAKIQHDMQNVERSADSANSGIGRLGSGLGGLLRLAAPLVGAFASFEFIKGSVEEFNKQDQALAQLDATLKSTNSTVGISRDALIGQAEALQKTTLYGDETTEQMQALLLTFTNVKGKIFSDAVPAIQDMSSKLGTDLNSSAIQVGKALNDPVKGIMALSRVGVSFSESQKDVIKNLAETGHVAEAQRLIIAELNKEFGGSAAAAAKAGTGPMIQLQHRLGDIREELGGVVMKIVAAFIPALDKMIEAFAWVVQAMKDVYHWVQRNQDTIITLGVVITGLAAAIGIGIIAYQSYVLWTERAAIWSGIKAVAAGIEMAAMVGLATAVEFVNAAFISSPVGWVVLGVIALIAIIGYLIYTYDGWGKQWDQLMKFLKFSWASFKDYFSLLWLNLQDSFMSGLEVIEKGWYHLKSLWDEDGAQAGLDRIASQQNTRGAEITKAKGVLDGDLKSAQAALTWELHGNGKGLSDITGDLKKKLGLGSSKGVSAVSAGLPKGAGGNLNGALGDATGAVKSKADSVNSGGQRSIVINIGKQIEKIEQHIIGGGREAADEIEGAVREAMRRVLYSMNNVAS